jgi:GntR family transcriptional regulator
MAIETTALMPACAPVLAADLENGSLHEALRELGRIPSLALSWISARQATAAETRQFRLTSRPTLLVERRIIFDQNEQPLEHTETAYLADRYVIDAAFALGGS